MGRRGGDGDCAACRRVALACHEIDVCAVRAAGECGTTIDGNEGVAVFVGTLEGVAAGGGAAVPRVLSLAEGGDRSAYLVQADDVLCEVGVEGLGYIARGGVFAEVCRCHGAFKIFAEVCTTRVLDWHGGAAGVNLAAFLELNL